MVRCEKCGEEYPDGTEHVCSPQPGEPAEEPEAEEKPEEGTGAENEPEAEEKPEESTGAEEEPGEQDTETKSPE